MSVTFLRTRSFGLATIGADIGCLGRSSYVCVKRFCDVSASEFGCTVQY